VVTIGYTPAKENLPKLASEIKAQGLEGKVAVLIGGSTVTKEDAEKINALFGETREEAVALAKKIIEKKNLKPN
jgi:methanogenic corrinoid protein MtbC1